MIEEKFKLLRIKKIELENYNNSIFERRYRLNFKHVEIFFEDIFSIDSQTLQDAYLNDIHLDNSIDASTKERLLFKFLSNNLFFSCAVTFFLCLVNRLTFIKNSMLPSKYQKVAFVERNDTRLYPRLKSLFKDGDLESHSLDIKSVKKVFSRGVRFNFSFKNLRLLIAEINKSASIISKIAPNQRYLFLKIFALCVFYRRFYNSIQGVDFLIDSCDNCYSPVQDSLASLVKIKLILIQNGGRMSLVSYGYVRCYMFISWADMYKNLIVGKIKSKVYLSILSQSVSRSDSKSIEAEFKDLYTNFDFLIVEQLTFPEKGVASDYSNHKYMLDRMINFINKNAGYKVGYLCRRPRDTKDIELKSVLLNNDALLEKNGIEIIENKFCEQAIKKSKVVVAIDSSTMLEAFFVGNMGFIVTNKLSNYMWLASLLTDDFISSRESQEVFNEKIVSLLARNVSSIREFFKHHNDISEVLDCIKSAEV